MTDKEKIEEETFLKRWSRRKNTDEENQKEKHASEEALENELSEEAKLKKTEQEEAEEKEMAENRAIAEAIDLETLDYESDFQPFMKKGVPEALKNLAMRKLWTSNPILANVDGLNDYDENFADPALNVFKSDWKVGRGFLTEEDDEKERLRKLALKEEQEKEEENASHIEDEMALEDNALTSVDEDENQEQGDEGTIAQVLDENSVKNNDDAMSEFQGLETQSKFDEVLEEAPVVKRVSLRCRLLEDE